MAEKIDGVVGFRLWAQTRAESPRDPLKPQSNAPYQAVWNAWLRFLAQRSMVVNGLPQSLHWLDARPVDVLDFLKPRAGMRANHQPERQLSEVTRRRYWRMLERLYGFAVVNGWVAENPATMMGERDQPDLPPQLGHILPPPLWKELPRHFPKGNTLIECRDRAILHLLYKLALTPEEIRTLKTSDINMQDVQLANEVSAQVLLHVDGPRLAQKRILPLPDECSGALRAWLSARGQHKPSCASPALLCAMTGEALSTSALFHLVSKVVLAANDALAKKGGVQTWMPEREGPQVLRNTAIVHWLNDGVPEKEVVRRVGLKNSRGLRHLRHLADSNATQSAV